MRLYIDVFWIALMLVVMFDAGRDRDHFVGGIAVVVMIVWIAFFLIDLDGRRDAKDGDDVRPPTR